jgi:hypothetical protein
MPGQSHSTTGVQYAVKSMFDRQTGFPGAKFNNVRESSQLLSTSLLANTGASGGSLSRIARGGNINIAKENILLAYRSKR